jgi:hypothetical protein
MSDRASFAGALLAFHCRVGARVALRAVAPSVGLFLFFYYVLRPEFSVFLTRVLLIENGLLVSGLTLALASLVAAKVTSSRVLAGAAGWIRHLPLTSSGHRRLAVIGAAAACLPVLAIIGFLIVLAAREARRPAAWFLVGLPFLGLASALYWTPLKNKAAARPLAFCAGWLFGMGEGLTLAAGFLCLAAADLAAGPLRRGGRVRLFVPYGRSPGTIALVSVRAVGWKFVPFYLAAFLPLILSRLFILNNRVSGRVAVSAACFGGAVSVVLFLSLLASSLAARRPPWPWLRSLPMSSGRRTAADAAFMGVCGLPLAAVTFSLDLWAGLATLAALPLLATRAAAALRRSPDLRAGPGPALALEGGLAALALALLPWISLGFLAAAPWALAEAARRERLIKVSRWSETRFRAEGDSQSWSAT